MLTKWTRLGSDVASVWLIGIAINLVSTGMFFDVAVRDIEMALAAFVLARLTEDRRTVLGSDTLHEQSAGKVHVAYIPQGKIIGLTKVPRLVDVCCASIAGAGTPDNNKLRKRLRALSDPKAWASSSKRHTRA